MKVEIVFQTNSSGRVYDVEDVYTKDTLLCLRMGNFVTKFPLSNIFSITHRYDGDESEEQDGN